MGKFIDLTGQTFNYLTVLEKTDKRGADRSIIWKCQCKCGKILEVNGSNLRNGHTKSCGCIKGESQKASSKNKKDLTNQKFGLLTALEATKERSSSGAVIWLCQCECGNFKKVSSTCLSNGLVQSCGCLISKGETKIASLLQEHNISFSRQKIFSDCVSSTTKNHYKFDFWIEDKYLIEFDGEQHFLYKNNGWNTKEQFLKTQQSDKEKNEYCKRNTIPLIRIPYTHMNSLSIEDLRLDTTKFLI